MHDLDVPRFARPLLALALLFACREPRVMEVKLHVEGMTCESCVEGISYELGRLEGVRSVVVDLDGGSAKVVFTEGEIDERAIESAIDDMGYEASVAAQPAEHAAG